MKSPASERGKLVASAAMAIVRPCPRWVDASGNHIGELARYHVLTVRNCTESLSIWLPLRMYVSNPFQSSESKSLSIDASEQYNILPLEASETITRPFSPNFGKNPSGTMSRIFSAKLRVYRNSSSRVCLYPEARNRSTRPLSSVSRDG